MTLCPEVYYTRGMNDYDFGWMVALYEGEGSTGAYRYEDTRKNTTVISITMVDEDVIRRFHELIKYGKVTQIANGSWKWYCTSYGDVTAVLKILYPYLSIRRRAQADKVFNSPPNSKWHPNVEINNAP